MEGYIHALIDVHYMRLGRLSDNQKYEQNLEMLFIEELENLLNYCKKATKNPNQSVPSSTTKKTTPLYHSKGVCQ